MPPIEAVLEENKALKGRVETLSEKVADLEMQLALFKRQQFGSGKTSGRTKRSSRWGWANGSRSRWR